uniref:Uncharacterized protein n=1 Tax=Anguilla anguilla TaxID=7936 RepID=A0A0E9XJY3_ANGAN
MIYKDTQVHSQTQHLAMAYSLLFNYLANRGYGTEHVLRYHIDMFAKTNEWLMFAHNPEFSIPVMGLFV